MTSSQRRPGLNRIKLNMPHIHQLSQSIINKIAAGEVIERPASIVKELMENAVDSGARRIDVSVEGGGAELVRVVDDGCGIATDELSLAVASHATSKLREADDLFRVGTLGFRGEALASIGEVSRMTLRSRTPDASGGAELEVVGGRLSEPGPCGCPPGTVIEVHNLFFNTPVRRKFLRTPQTEFGHASEAFSRIALASPRVHFTLRHGKRQVFDLPAGEDWRSRIGRVFDSRMAESLIPVESAESDVRISGYVAHPNHSRSNGKMQYLLLNGRFVRDRSLQHALGEAYRGLLTVGRYPIAFLRIDMPPELVDVNVHPTKLEVRFQDAGRLYSQLLSTLRGKFLTTDLTSRIEPGPDEGPAAAHDPQQSAQLRQELVDWAKGQVSQWPQRAAGPSGELRGPSGELRGPSGELRGPEGAISEGPLQLNRLPRSWNPADATDTRAADGPTAAEMPPEMAAETTGPTARAIQMHDRYLVTESQEGVVVIDQHALHERILYEQLRLRIESGTLDVQNLLVPEPVDLAPSEAALALENRELLGRLGLVIEPFGGDTVVVSGYPAMLANMNPAEVLRGLLDRLLQGGKPLESRDVLDDLLHTIACKAAIKAGDRLAPEEIHSLLQQRHLVADPHHCPHGRPAALVFTRAELDKRFKRT